MIRSLCVAVASIAASLITTSPACAQADLAQCLRQFGGENVEGGAAFSVKNICDQCVKFDPRVKHSSGKITYVSTAVVLGQPILSIALNPNEQQRLSYGRSFGDGTYTPVMTDPRSCN
jgi:hypothetical protein